MINEIISHPHPIVVHFPIVIITLAALYDLLFAAFKHTPSRNGDWLWLFAFISAWIAIGTGPGHDAQGNTNLFQYHDKLATITTWLSLFVALFRFYFVIKKKNMGNQWLVIGTILSMVCAIGILSVGYFGGKMVYDQGIGVKIEGEYVNPPRSFTDN
ncbi:MULTISPECIES: DUF2231 domain-containing protein [Niallia]|uniref:DUF2231 domain-containing protein n=1 Tax=Niallia TaxID=2837506 RepID=UPI001ED9FCCD|nr:MULTISPECIES: DUF2231 domain-containing protein [Niallia]MED4040093.1 hypothetical protein [Niallia taxi]UPO91102.1 hypothetical protein L8T27_026500 [Niallia sp. Man26]